MSELRNDVLRGTAVTTPTPEPAHEHTWMSGFCYGCNQGADKVIDQLQSELQAANRVGNGLQGELWRAQERAEAAEAKLQAAQEDLAHARQEAVLIGTHTDEAIAQWEAAEAELALLRPVVDAAREIADDSPYGEEDRCIFCHALAGRPHAAYCSHAKLVAALDRGSHTCH